MDRFRVVGAVLWTLVMLVAASIPASAKEPREWRIVYVDTGEVVRITDAQRALEVFSEIHYSITGGTPIEPESVRTPTAEVFGNPCNPPYVCERLWYRYYAPSADKPAYMSYYLTDGTLYETWTHPDLQSKMDSYRNNLPSANGLDTHDSAGIATYVPLVLVVVTTAASGLVWISWRRKRKSRAAL